MKCILLSIFSFTILFANAQGIERYVKSNTVQIKTNSPDSVDFSDLEVIGKSIGDSRVVMLGEQGHGDAATFLAKTRLIKYLHEKKGFNVLAFESDYFSLNEGWDALQNKPASVKHFLAENILPVWSGCDACRELLYRYIPKTWSTERPLIMTGFDNQLNREYSLEHFIPKLDSVLQHFDLPVTKDPIYKSRMLPMIDLLNKSYEAIRPPSMYDSVGMFIQTMKTQLSSKLPANAFWMTMINNLEAEVTEYRNQKGKYEAYNVPRDMQMAANLQWLTTEKYSSEKVIVWAHNYHVGKLSADLWHSDAVTSGTMGSFFNRYPGNAQKTYIIGFDSYDGKAGQFSVPIFTAAKPKTNSFENWISAGYDFAFTDFRQMNSKYNTVKEMFYMKALHHQNVKSNWAQIFDGIFFVRHMFSCSRDEKGF